jgi:hypothetical protein
MLELGRCLLLLACYLLSGSSDQRGHLQLSVTTAQGFTEVRLEGRAQKAQNMDPTTDYYTQRYVLLALLLPSFDEN